MNNVREYMLDDADILPHILSMFLFQLRIHINTTSQYLQKCVCVKIRTINEQAQ